MKRLELVGVVILLRTSGVTALYLAKIESELVSVPTEVGLFGEFKGVSGYPAMNTYCAFAEDRPHSLESGNNNQPFPASE